MLDALQRQREHARCEACTQTGQQDRHPNGVAAGLVEVDGMSV